MFGYICGLNTPAINLKQCMYKFGRRNNKYNIYANQQINKVDRKKEGVKTIETGMIIKISTFCVTLKIVTILEESSASVFRIEE
jgi:hypothetical protein